MEVDSTTTTQQENQIPNELTLFARGVWAVMTIWSGLRIAIHNHWEGDSKPEDGVRETAQDKKKRLCEELVDAFFTSKDPKGPGVDDIEDFLLEFMDVEFGVLIEDDSERVIARDLKKLWFECTNININGDASTSTRSDNQEQSLLEQFETAAAKVKSEEGNYGTRGGEESSDDDDDGDDDQAQASTSGTTLDSSGMDIDNKPNKNEKVVDDDGFELVQKKR